MLFVKIFFLMAVVNCQQQSSLDYFFGLDNVDSKDTLTTTEKPPVNEGQGEKT